MSGSFLLDQVIALAPTLGVALVGGGLGYLAGGWLLAVVGALAAGIAFFTWSTGNFLGKDLDVDASSGPSGQFFAG